MLPLRKFCVRTTWIIPKWKVFQPGYHYKASWMHLRQCLLSPFSKYCCSKLGHYYAPHSGLQGAKRLTCDPIRLYLLKKWTCSRRFKKAFLKHASLYHWHALWNFLIVKNSYSKENQTTVGLICYNVVKCSCCSA